MKKLTARVICITALIATLVCMCGCARMFVDKLSNDEIDAKAKKLIDEIYDEDYDAAAEYIHPDTRDSLSNLEDLLEQIYYFVDGEPGDLTVESVNVDSSVTTQGKVYTYTVTYTFGTDAGENYAIEAVWVQNNGGEGFTAYEVSGR